MRTGPAVVLVRVRSASAPRPRFSGDLNRGTVMARNGIGAALVIGSLAGLAAGQTTLVVDSWEILTTEDLLAGEFEGQTFELGPDLTIEVSGRGRVRLDLVPQLTVPGPSEWHGALDLRGATINVRSGGEFESPAFANATVNVHSGAEVWMTLVPVGGGEVNVYGHPSTPDAYPYWRPVNGGRVNLHGGEFTRDGVFVDRVVIDDLSPRSVFTATLTDGAVSLLEGWRLQDLSGFAFVDAELPPLDTTPLVVSAPIDERVWLRPGQSLTVVDGGMLENGFAAVNAEVVVAGGRVRRPSTVVGSSVTIRDSGRLSEVDALAGSEVNSVGGDVSYVFADDQSTVRIAGGRFGGGSLHLADITIVGDDFRADGAPVTSLPPHPCDDPNLAGCDDGARVQAITATLADGSPFLLDKGFAQGRVTFEPVPVPPAVPLDLVVDSVDESLTGLRAGQRVRVVDGGRLLNELTVVGGEVVLEGGRSVGVGASEADVTISGGEHGGMSLHAGSRLLVTGGTIPWQRVLCLRDTVATIEGGFFGGSVGFSGERVTISGGEFANGGALWADANDVAGGIFEGRVTSGAGTTIVSDGEFRSGFNLTTAGLVMGGTFGTAGSIDGLDVYYGVVDVTGGRVLGHARFGLDSLVRVAGGTFEGSFRIGFASAAPDGQGQPEVELVGGPFFVDGESVDGLTPGGTVEIETRGGVLTGRLEDGQPVRIELNPEPPVISFPFEPSAPQDYVAPDATLLVSWSSARCSFADLVEPLGVVDGADTAAFIDAFITGDSMADGAFPIGIVDLSDVDAFISAALIGCP